MSLLKRTTPRIPDALKALSCSAAILFAMVSVNTATASEWNKMTRLTVHETIQVPGATLPPGHYVVKLADSPSNRHIVQFFNQDESKLYSTALAISDQRSDQDLTGDTQLWFYETRGNEPPALRAWFYPGDLIGQEFVYPKSEAQIIAKNSGRSVPTTEDQTEMQLKSRSTPEAAPDLPSDTRVYRSNAEGKEVPQNEAQANSSRMDREQKWRDWQKANKRYGEFDVIVVSPIYSNVLPDTAAKRTASVQNVVTRLDEHSKAFDKRFKEALDSSTVKIADRDELKSTVDRLNRKIDEFKEDYNKNEMKEAHAALMRAMELASSVNRFMLRSEFGSSEDAWSAVRSDLNTLAAMHQFPVIELYTLNTAKQGASRSK